MTDVIDSNAPAASVSPLGTDTRNVADKYKWWEHNAIVENLDETRSDFLTVCMNLDGDFNLSSLVRNTSWFNAAGVWIVGRKKWDRRGSVGTHNYMNVTYRAEPLEAVAELKALGYTVVGAEISDDSVELQNYEFPKKVAVIFGEEGLGLSEEMMAACDAIVSIPGRGAVRSLNVANTGGIFLWEYHRQHYFV